MSTSCAFSFSRGWKDSKQDCRKAFVVTTPPNCLRAGSAPQSLCTSSSASVGVQGEGRRGWRADSVEGTTQLFLCTPTIRTTTLFPPLAHAKAVHSQASRLLRSNTKKASFSRGCQLKPVPLTHQHIDPSLRGLSLLQCPLHLSEHGLTHRTRLQLDNVLTTPVTRTDVGLGVVYAQTCKSIVFCRRKFSHNRRTYFLSTCPHPQAFLAASNTAELQQWAWRSRDEFAPT